MCIYKSQPLLAENTCAGQLSFCCCTAIGDSGVPVSSTGRNSAKYPPGCFGELWSNPGPSFEESCTFT